MNRIEEPEAMKEIREIRRRIHERTKDMSPEQRIAYEKQVVAELLKETGLQLNRMEKSST